MPLGKEGFINLFQVVDNDGNPARVSAFAGVYRLAVEAIIGGGGIIVTDTDDNSIAVGQTLPLIIDENYIFDGTTWIRQQGGVDNAVAPASPQGQFVGGVVTSPLGAYANGDVSLLHFDTTGRLLVDAEGVTDTDDNAVPPGQITGLCIDLNYVFDGTNWVRQHGGVDNAVAPASPQTAFVGGTVTSPVGVFADGDISLLHFDTSGRLLTAASGGATVTDTDDDSITSGQVLPLEIEENYFFDGTNWRRGQSRAVSAAISESLM